MWVYRKFPKENLWVVGFYSPDGAWHSDGGDFETEEVAMLRVNFLNGGDGISSEAKYYQGGR